MDRRTFLASVAGLPLAPGSFDRRPRRLLVLGDSVPWGQGLRDADKMHVLLARELERQDGVAPEVRHYACSGATIEVPPSLGVSDPSGPEWPRELPRSQPTVNAQLDQAMRDVPDRRFDVIVVNGGINDVVVRKIFDLTTTTHTIQTRSRRYCREAMGRLLDRIRSTFVTVNPDVKVLVLGYYNIFSQYSELPDIGQVLRALAVSSASLPKRGGQKSVSGRPLTIREIIVRNSTAFRDATRVDLAAAVDIANASAPPGVFRFVDPAFSDREAAFVRPGAGTASLIWGLDGNANAEDSVRVERAAACGRFGGSGLGDRFTCERASVGHPNVAGARRYADTMMRDLQLATRGWAPPRA